MLKRNFLNLSNISELKDSVPVLILNESEIKKSKFKPIELIKKQLEFSGKSIGNLSYFNDTPFIVFSTGVAEELSNLKLQKLGGRIVNFINSLKIKNATLFFGAEIDNKGLIKQKNKNTKDHCNILFGAILQSYRFNKYFETKKKDKEIKISSISINVFNQKDAIENFKDLEILINNVFLTRDLVSEPSNILNPESYANICKSLVDDGLEIEVLSESDMTKLGMNALLGVGKGSAYKSQLVILKWNGAKDKKTKPLAFVGKGVTFDTGGISIKPSNNMEDMKTDMAGSAVVVGLLRNLAQRKAKVNAVGVIGLVENMPSSTAQKPGDVVKSMSGQTIEIINTDAEGRLVLADALYYTNQKFNPQIIVDLATLTGAIIIALADVNAGLFSNDDDLSLKIEKAGKDSGETVWRLPISEEYDEMINSDIADMRNTGAGRGAGSTTAAQFLKRFIGNTKWAHLDIAGVAWKGKGDPLAIKGATGFGVRLLNQFIKDNYEK